MSTWAVVWEFQKLSANNANTCKDGLTLSWKQMKESLPCWLESIKLINKKDAAYMVKSLRRSRIKLIVSILQKALYQVKHMHTTMLSSLTAQIVALTTELP